jgi:antitoxin component YwqK of YwqJK toxin-antitoxin module
VSQIESLEEHRWLDGRLRYRYLNKEGTEAEAVEHYGNGQLKFRYLLHYGQMRGTCRMWYENGSLQCEEEYINGKLHGLKRAWHNNGILEAEINYKNGVKDGSYKTWYENGKPREVSVFVNGNYDGTRTNWYANGLMWTQCHYRAGVLHGVEKKWYEDGKLQSTKAYARGMHIPIWVNNLIVTGQLRAAHILKITNAEVRRLCLEELGYERFLSQMEHEVIEKEGEQELVKINWVNREEPICLVRVRCPSTGTFYTLRVPPSMKTIKDAVAWTFGMKNKEYVPEIET